MTIAYKGKTLDQDGKTIPFANVYISNEFGTRVSEKAHVKSDANGNYSINVSVPVGNSSGAINVVPIGSYITMKSTGLPFHIEKIDFSQSGIVNKNLQVKMKEIITNEVVVEENRDKYLCEKVRGGTWDPKTKSCVLPKRNLWNKMKPWQKTSAVAAITAVITFILTKK